jgi:hypothetical protein
VSLLFSLAAMFLALAVVCLAATAALIVGAIQ